MKLLLINPKRVAGYVIQPPLGLGYLASIAKKYCSLVELWDMSISNKIYNQRNEQLSKLSFDIIGISAFTSDIPEVNRILEIIKSSGSKATILIGGPHSTAVKENIFKSIPLADYAFHGEAETGFEMFLLQALEGGIDHENIPALIFKDTYGKVIVNEGNEIQDLDKIEFPLWKLMDPSSYPPAPHGAFYKNFPIAPIIFTRGCPMYCTFCLGANHKPRKRSIDNIKAEIRYLVNELNVKELLVEDENFAIHKRLLNEFCEFMIDEYGGKLTWHCPSGLRLDSLDEEKVRLMKASGCHSLAVGVEFGTEKMHKETKKKLNLDIIKEKLDLLHSIGGINVTGFFMMGLPQETKEDILKTIDFALALPLESAQFNIFMPQPGTEIWNQFCFNDIDFNNYHVHSVSFQHPSISKKELVHLKKMAYLKFYLRPKIVFSTLKQINSPWHLYYLLKRFANSIY